MDFKEILNNIDIESLLSLFSKQKEQNAQPEPTQNTSYDASNPYWSLPNYTNPPAPQQPEQPNTATVTNQNNGFDISQILNIAKIIMPLLNKNQTTLDTQTEIAQNTDSQILTLKKVQ